MTAGFKYDTNWCVFTGAPSSGKTSVIEEMAHRGYAVQNEVARELIEGALRNGKNEILGIVLNGLSPRRIEYYSNYRYYRSYKKYYGAQT